MAFKAELLKVDQVTEAADRLIALADRLAPSLRNSFLRMVSRIQDAWTLNYLEGLINAGRIQDVVSVVELASRAFAQDVNEAMAAGAKATADFLANEATLIIGFDRTNVAAVDAMRANTLRLVREITNEQQNAIRMAMVQGIQGGLGPREQARAFRDAIGLNSRQTMAVANFRRLLQQRSAEALQRKLRDRRFDPTVNRAIATGEALSAEQIDNMTNRYAARQQKYRAETIARTEALRAVHAGNENMIRQAIEAGTIPKEAIRRKWVTASDERVRFSHFSMNGQERAYGEAFRSGAGYDLMYPGDPSAPASETINCRCSVTTRLDMAVLGSFGSLRR